jgi:hypothetical protein
MWRVEEEVGSADASVMIVDERLMHLPVLVGPHYYK